MLNVTMSSTLRRVHIPNEGPSPKGLDPVILNIDRLSCVITESIYQSAPHISVLRNPIQIAMDSSSPPHAYVCRIGFQA